MAAMTEQSRISPDGEAIIPKELCERLDWLPGMEIEIDTGPGGMVVRPKSKPRERISIEEFRRRVPRHEGPPVSLEEMEQAILDEAAERFARKTRRD